MNNKKPIVITDETLHQLKQLKLDLKAKTLDQVIKHLLKKGKE